MNWRAWNTRALVSVVLAALAVVTLIFPPVSFFLGLIGMSFGSTAWLTSPEPSESRQAARAATLVSGAAFVLLLAGAALYAWLG